MKNIFKILDVKAMMQFNIVSLIITGICLIFAINVFLTKGQQPELEHWKYVAIIIGLVVVSLMFIGTLVSLIYFFSVKNKQSK